MAQKLAGIAHEALFQVFIDVRKAYDSLDRGWCMDIIGGCGMGQKMARLIAHNWDNIMFTPKVKRLLGTPLGTGRVFTQVDPASPMKFNIVVDTVVRSKL